MMVTSGSKEKNSSKMYQINKDGGIHDANAESSKL